MPQLIGAALLAAGIGTAVIFGTLTYAAVAGYVIYSALTYIALKALAPGDAGMSSSGIQVNSINATAPHRIIYGQQRVGGTITYQEATDDNKYLHLFICLAGHEVEEIGQIYINDEAVTLDGSGFVTSHDWASKIRIKKHLGSDTQVVDADFLSETENAAVNSNFRGQGIAYLYVRMEYDREVFAQGLPLITAVIKGRKVYDPRTTTTAYSANAALCVRDYASADFGVNATSDEFDDTIWGAEADICDEAVSLDAGGSENRYELNGSFTLDMPPKDVLPRMLTSCAGTFFWSQGEFILKTGYYSTPVASFDESHLRSGIQIDPRVSSRDNFNTVRGTFMDASQKWITVDYPEISGAAFVTEDNGEENSIDLPLPFTTSSPMAQRLSKVTLYRNREQITFTGKFSLEAYSVQVGDNINITNDQMGFSSKPFEVQAWQLIYEKGSPIAVNMTLREISAAAFSWAAEESDIIGNETTLPPRSFYYQKARYDITVTSFPVTAADAKTEFQTSVGTPIDGDTAIFSTKTGVDTVVQEVWQYTASTDTWSKKLQDVYGGNIVDGSVDTPIIASGAASGRTIDLQTVNFTDDSTFGSYEEIGEYEYQVESDDDLAPERLHLRGEFSESHTFSLTSPSTDAWTKIEVWLKVAAYVRNGSDVLIADQEYVWLSHGWINQNLTSVKSAYRPYGDIRISKGFHYDAGDLLALKFFHKQTRVGSTASDFTTTIPQLYSEILEYKR